MYRNVTQCPLHWTKVTRIAVAKHRDGSDKKLWFHERDIYSINFKLGWKVFFVVSLSGSFHENFLSSINEEKFYHFEDKSLKLKVVT